MSESLFSKRAEDKINSPEKLDEYIRVTTPTVWILLAGIIVLLIGFFAWAYFGTISRTLPDGSVTYVHPISYVIN
ncbi:MAG: hypothetical protein K6F99_06395 [Lachnospiraceae bacterium]|nr:hypothetical protein [Lachnospiraceae bacterium]